MSNFYEKQMLDTSFKLAVSVLGIMKIFGHKTFSCAGCKEQVDIDELMKNGGYCDPCITKRGE